MSKLYAVIQVCPERRYNYKMDEIRESFSFGLPFIFADRKRAYQEAEKKRKAHVPCFVKEFPFNPLDKRLETLEAKVQADADYISELEQLVKELEEENARLRSCTSDDSVNYEAMARCAAMQAFAVTKYFTDKCKELGIEVDE